MKLDIKNKALLWSVLEKYDGISEYTPFCDSISNFIKGTFNGDDMLTVYRHSNLIDASDRKKIDATIGDEINSYLFSI
jgi:N-acetylglucosamine kinase-like BadF-type ATPase